ncbi:hypothetical protein Plav_0317 [Parvibaculum lavamentivorans DS-1]|uniref:JAB domain-containing protein n=1 Tax=Parvibaculum lavamentivorans (strain DS-1 / DSM 13023 / NCIMB 13966) TaxID=402881 RepID=A7HPV7_PARL1|nr:Mov34/MPN/PAD-1 family protein [Parvibaculum lavamentivorans]ABS61940.1 hypothetical protein Plav_0317 [Parvibaculum lavamentivorans DS-1]
MIDTPLAFELPNNLGRLEIETTALKHMWRHRQTNLLKREAGGQLFAAIDADAVCIVEATGPRPTDKRGRYHYHPDRTAEKREIEDRYAAGLHFVGDWHTHPQGMPSPSDTDLSNFQDMVTRSEHSLPGFILIVVGKQRFPSGLHVTFVTATGFYELTPHAPV